ncbi:PAS domain S-box protein [Pseudonocardia eucalypti]|uniref:PAS domain S-box protein n=1 Tax=Pseudonocardia eucalypti TaxID=648755 RepID=A0ABP9RBG0_9PSEU|nr:PAS domain S-box-containing protein [Pseudonocardia eucalypti]
MPEQSSPAPELADLIGSAVLSSPADAIIATDREGIIRFWNPGAERIFGFGRAEAVDRSLDLVIPERLRAAHWRGYEQVMRTGVSRYGDGDLLSVPGLTKSGARISVEFTIVPVVDADGRVAGMAAIMRDVTAKYEELKALRRKLAGASESKPNDA